MANDKQYTIGPITKRTEFNQAGQALEVYEINFTTVSGVRDRITIPEEEYTAEKVKALIAAATKVHEDIMS